MSGFVKLNNFNSTKEKNQRKAEASIPSSEIQAKGDISHG